MRKNMKLTGNHLLLCLCITINHLFSVPSPGIRKSIESLTSVKIKLRLESQTKRENWEKEVFFSLMWASVEGQCMALEAAMQLLNLWHLPFGGKLCHPCLIWITELPKTCFKCSWHGGTFNLCVRLLFKKKRRKQLMLLQSNAFGVILIIVIALLKQFQKCLKWSLIWTARKIVQNLGNEAKETNIFKCLTCFSDFAINSCYTLTPLFCVRFKSVLNMRFHAKSVTASKGKIA